MIAAIHQPQYLPWCGYFDKIDKADVFCFLDNVQYKKNEWQNRNRIKTAQGWQWLTVPVRYKFPQKINEVSINSNVHWRHKHLQALISNYTRSPYFNEYIDYFREFYSVEWESFVELNIALINGLCNLLGIEVKTRIASELSLREDPTDRLIDICTALGADTYLSGADGAKYMEMDKFENMGVKVIFQNFVSPHYRQQFGDFELNLSVVDLLFNCGNESLKYIRGSL